MNVTRTVLISLSVFLILAGDTNALSSKLKKLRDKLHKMYKSKFGKVKMWEFLGLDPSEYPGTNAKHREENRQKWEEYYDCLRLQERSLDEHDSVTPEALQGFEGGSVRFECKICLSPLERLKIDTIEWDWAGVNDSSLEPVEYNEHVFLSPVDRSLHVYNLQMEQTGQYMCRLGDAVTAPYFLTVVNGTNMSVVHTENSPEGPYPQKIVYLKQYNLVLDTEWGPWSPCSKCNVIGRKHRLGYCTVFHQETVPEENSPHLNVSDNFTSTTYKLTTKAPVTMENGVVIEKNDLELIRVFKFGIPCRSHIMPEFVQYIPEVQNRSDEVMVAYCKETCPENRIFEVKDKNGKVIEIANNSAGIYSMLQGPPMVEPEVERRLQYEKKNYAVTVACPGNLNSDAPIQWQIGGKNVVPSLLAKESKGRIYISATDRVNIRKAKVSDSNLYSCWQHKELAGTVKLVVEKNRQFTFDHHIMLLGMVSVLGTFAYVFIKAFFGRKYAKTTS